MRRLKLRRITIKCICINCKLLRVYQDHKCGECVLWTLVVCMPTLMWRLCEWSHTPHAHTLSWRESEIVITTVTIKWVLNQTTLCCYLLLLHGGIFHIVDHHTKIKTASGNRLYLYITILSCTSI